MFPRYIFSLLVLTLLALPAVATTINDLPRTDDVIEIDGVLNDAAWNSAVEIDLKFETNPGENIPARVETKAYLVEDGENLFLGFKAFDPEPEKIRAYLRDRDTAWSDDNVGIMIDTYNDERRAFEFYVNALGVQMDKTLDDTSGGDQGQFDMSWDAIWDSAGRVTDDGYVVEMRIPLSQLRFPDVEGPKTWGITLRRNYPRDRTYIFWNHPKDRNRSCLLCQNDKLVGLDGSRPSRDLEIVPTLTGSLNESTEDPGFEPLQRGDADIEAGVTVRWGITPDLTANLTVNPDFSQIEADVSQLDVNNRFTLFFPEKRPFFLEGADYYSTPIDAVYTRTIAAPDFGAKLTGKRGNSTFGVIGARDAVTNILFPGLYSSDADVFELPNTSFVGRYSYGFENTSSLGALVTLREGDGYHNHVAGVDGRWKINDQHRLFFQHLESRTQYPLDIALDFDQPLDEFDGSATVVGYNYASREWFGRMRYVDYKEGFRADSGFVGQVGGKKQIAVLGRIFHGTEDTWWTRIRAQTYYEKLKGQNGELAEEEFGIRFGIGGPFQTWFMIRYEKERERDDGILYNADEIGMYMQMVPIAGLNFTVFHALGEQIDYSNGGVGDRKLWEPGLSWNMSRNVLLRLQGVYSQLDTKDGDAIFKAMLADTRLTWQFNLRSFLRLTVQYQDIERNLDVYIDPTVDAREKDVGRQLLYSYKINPQTVFFLGYSDKYIDNDFVDGLTVEDRTIFMKIGYAWTP